MGIYANIWSFFTPTVRSIGLHDLNETSKVCAVSIFDRSVDRVILGFLASSPKHGLQKWLF